jgi:uncharacterized delta-60 repeat protein
MAKYNADGSPDTTFGRGGFDGDGKVTTDVTPADGYHNDLANAISVLPDGRILLAGTSFSVQPSEQGDFRINQYSLARYNADGSPDTTFGGGIGNRTVTFGFGNHLASDMTVLPDGKILLGGSEAGLHEFLLSRLNADGSPDLSFNGGTDCRATYSFGGNEDDGLSLGVQSDGRIILTGPVVTNPSYMHNVGMVRFVGDPVQAAPMVSSVVVNGGAAQRSQVRTLTITFDRPVTLDSGALTLSLLDTGGATTDASSALRAPTSPDGGRTWAVSLGAAAGSTDRLADGVYRLNVDPTKVRANGIAMTTAASFTFHQLFGDINGSKSVNAADYTAFRNAFGKSRGQTGYDDALDFDGNGTINALDYTQFRSRFGKTFAY